MADRARGRPRRHSEYDRLVASLPKPMTKRPKYLNGIGVFRGGRGDTAWVKIRLPHGGIYRGRAYEPGSSLEIKLGSLSSWTWEQLEAKRSDLQGLADRDEALEDEPTVRFNSQAQEWLERARNRVKDYDSLELHVNRHLLGTFGPMPLSAITVNDVNRWAARQLKSLAPGTVKRQRNTLNAILNDALRSGHIDANPCRNADPIRGIVPRQRFLDGAELSNLLNAAGETADWLPDIILWCVHSGMRKGEVRALEWPDVQTLPDGRVLASIRTSKADQPRFVQCTPTMVEILDRQAGRRQEGNDHVFPVTKMTLRRKWEKARKQVGLEDVTMHDLRRTHSTQAAAAGVDLRTLADRIGHTDLTMLHRTYAAVVGSASEEAVSKIERVFGGMTAKATAKNPKSKATTK